MLKAVAAMSDRVCGMLKSAGVDDVVILGPEESIWGPRVQPTHRRPHEAESPQGPDAWSPSVGTGNFVPSSKTLVSDRSPNVGRINDLACPYARRAVRGALKLSAAVTGHTCRSCCRGDSLTDAIADTAGSEAGLSVRSCVAA